MKIYLNKKSLDIKSKTVTSFGKFSGLMFRTKQTQNLLFHFNKGELPAIHSFFVFFTFLAVWLDEKNNVLSWNLVRPFTPFLCPKNHPTKLLELPLNRENSKILAFFDDKKETFKYLRG